MHKNKMRHSLIFLLFSVLLAACQPSTLSGATPTFPPLPLSTPTETSTPKPSPTTPAINPALKDILGSAPYTVSAEGNAVVDLGDTPATERIELMNISRVKTNDGLAKEITYGYEKMADGSQGGRIVYSELGGGWYRELDWASGTIDKPLQISTELGENVAALNTLFALYYSENDPIPADAVVPNYYINTTGADNIWLSSQPIRGSVNDAKMPITRFTKSNQYFTEPKILAYTTSGGDEMVVLVNNNLNPTDENKDQTIILQKVMGRERYEWYKQQINGRGDTVLKDFLIDNGNEVTFVIVPPSVIDGIAIPWNANTWQDRIKRSDPAARMQEKGKLLSLFTQQEQADVNGMLAGIYGGPVFLDGHTISVQVKLPVKIALYRLLLNFESWLNAPGQE